MTYESILTGAALDAFNAALPEGRLYWRVADQYGRSCNGGSPYRLLPARPGEPGEWSPLVDYPLCCKRGYHATHYPIRFVGLTVALVEVRGALGRLEDKIAAEQIRELGRVLPWECVDMAIWAAASRPHLIGANLTGAWLNGAQLDGANLTGAWLNGANLTGAHANKQTTWPCGFDPTARDVLVLS